MKIKLGIDVLEETNFKLLEGKKVGLVTNPTGVNSGLISTIDLLYEADNVDLIALYGPEHGVRGDYPAGEKVSNYTDKKTGLPVYSLYGQNRKPTDEMLEGIEVIIYDIQDIGSRSYTYISTMGLVMEAAAEKGIEVIVLDRPNPLGGEKVEGYLVDEGRYSFISQFNIPYVYGLTCGELAVMLNEEKMLDIPDKCDLTVVEMEGWERWMNFEDTGLEWIPTSPHIPHKFSAYYYSATGILGELYVFSIGVGYTLPFQCIAAEWIDENKLAEKMNGLGLEGVYFRPVSYKPFYSVSQGSKVNGIQIHITDFSKVDLVEIQFYFLQAHHELYPDKNVFELTRSNRLRVFDNVNGTSMIREKFSENFRVADISDLLKNEAEKFKDFSKKYYLY
jgi:uncharacterized protein YbbC (DUF1343 family)